MATESEHSGPNSFPLGSHRKTSTRSSTCSNLLYCKTEITKKNLKNIDLKRLSVELYNVWFYALHNAALNIPFFVFFNLK